MSTEPAYNHAFARVAMGLGYATSDHVKRALYERRKGDRRPLWLALADCAAIPYESLELIERKVKNLEDPCPKCRTMRYRYTVETPIKEPCPVCNPEAAPAKPFAHHERERQRKLRRDARKAAAGPQNAQALPAARVSSPRDKPGPKKRPLIDPQPLKVQPRASTRRLKRSSWSDEEEKSPPDKRAATPVSWTSIPGMGTRKPRTVRPVSYTSIPGMGTVGPPEKAGDKTHVVPAEPLSVAPLRSATRRSQRPKKLPKNALPSFGKASEEEAPKKVEDFVPVYHPGTEPIRRRKRKGILYWVASLVAIGLAAYAVNVARLRMDRQTPDVVRAPHGPSLDSPPSTALWSAGDYVLIPRQAFSVEAQVLAIQPYTDRDSGLSPLDMAVGWGPMSNPRNLSSIELIQEGRALRAEGLPIGEAEFHEHCWNLAIIPANRAIEDMLDNFLRVGNLVELRGQIVDVERGTRTWHSGTTPGSTRILWLRNCRLVQ